MAESYADLLNYVFFDVVFYFQDADCFNYFEYLSDSAKNAEALLRHFVDNSTGTECKYI